MTEIFTDSEFTVVGFMRSELEAANIPCFVRNQDVGIAMSGIPTAFPSLCVANDSDIPKARMIVASFVAARKDKAPEKRSNWICPKCGESVPPTFEQCWQCEGIRSSAVE
jgi:hypothetical protein